MIQPSSKASSSFIIKPYRSNKELSKDKTPTDFHLSATPPEDTDSSYALYQFKHQEKNIPSATKKEIQLIKKTLTIIKRAPRSINKASRSIIPAYKTITLPEAIILAIEINQPVLQTGKAYLRLHSFAYPSFIFQLKWNPETGKPKTWRIQYNPFDLSFKIYKTEHQVGQFKIISRARKIEEIVGTFQKKPLSIDPIWNPKRRKDIISETFKYGTHKWELYYNKNETVGFWETPQIKMKQSITTTPKKQCIQTQKKFEIADHHIHTQLYFFKNILSPCYMKMHIHPI